MVSNTSQRPMAINRRPIIAITVFTIRFRGQKSKDRADDLTPVRSSIRLRIVLSAALRSSGLLTQQLDGFLELNVFRLRFRHDWFRRSSRFCLIRLLFVVVGQIVNSGSIGIVRTFYFDRGRHARVVAIFAEKRLATARGPLHSRQQQSVTVAQREQFLRSEEHTSELQSR